jgi:hypothetical protein
MTFVLFQRAAVLISSRRFLKMPHGLRGSFAFFMGLTSYRTTLSMGDFFKAISCATGIIYNNE